MFQEQKDFINNLIAFFSDEKLQIEKIKKTVKTIQKELKKNNCERVNLTEVKHKFKEKLQNIKSEILELNKENKNNIQFNFFTEIIKKQNKTNHKYTDEELVILGTKIYNVGSIFSNYLQGHNSFITIFHILKLLDGFYYFVDDKGNEIEYVFLTLSEKFLNQNIDLIDLEFLLEFIILLVILDSDEDYYDEFEEDNFVYLYNKGVNIILTECKNPINMLIYIVNNKITLPNTFTLLNIFKTNIFGFSLQNIESINLKFILDSAFMDYDNTLLFTDFEDSNNYFTSFGHYLGYILDFNIKNDKFGISQLKNLYLIDYLRKTLIENNNELKKYSQSKTGGGLFNIKKKFSSLLNKSYDILFTKPSKLLKKYNIKLNYNINYNTIKTSQSNTLFYFIKSKEYNVIPTLLLNSPTNISLKELNANNKNTNDNDNINTYLSLSKDYKNYHTLKNIKYFNRFNTFYHKHNIELLHNVISNIINKLKSTLNIIDYVKILKFIPILFDTQIIKDDKLDNKNISESLLYILNKINIKESKIINKFIYSIVICTNLYYYAIIYYNNNRDQEKLIKTVVTGTNTNFTTRKIAYNNYKLNENFYDMLKGFLIKISSSIINNTDTFNSNLLELIIRTKLRNYNINYLNFENKLNLTDQENLLLCNIFDTVISSQKQELYYLIKLLNINKHLYNIIQSGGNNSNSFRTATGNVSDSFRTATGNVSDSFRTATGNVSDSDSDDYQTPESIPHSQSNSSNLTNYLYYLASIKTRVQNTIYDWFIPNEENIAREASYNRELQIAFNANKSTDIIVNNKVPIKQQNNSINT